MNEKKENFKRISESRKNKIIELISKLHNLQNTAFYEYSDADIDAMFHDIYSALEEEKEKFKKMEDVKDIVETKLRDLGFNVYLSNKYTFVIEKDGKEKYIKVVNTKRKYAHWKVTKKDEIVEDNLFYICVRNDGDYKFHIVPSYELAMNIKVYHEGFIRKNGNNGASLSMREFVDKPSNYNPEKEENEYLDNWDILD